MLNWLRSTGRRSAQRSCKRLVGLFTACGQPTQQPQRESVEVASAILTRSRVSYLFSNFMQICIKLQPRSARIGDEASCSPAFICPWLVDGQNARQPPYCLQVLNLSTCLPLPAMSILLTLRFCVYLTVAELALVLRPALSKRARKAAKRRASSSQARDTPNKQKIFCHSF